MTRNVTETYSRSYLKQSTQYNPLTTGFGTSFSNLQARPFNKKEKFFITDQNMKDMKFVPFVSERDGLGRLNKKSIFLIFLKI